MAKMSAAFIKKLDREWLSTSTINNDLGLIILTLFWCNLPLGIARSRPKVKTCFTVVF
jgi:hypothetical protein